MALTGQVAAGWDLMGAPLADAKLTEATENPVYVAGRGLTVGRP